MRSMWCRVVVLLGCAGFGAGVAAQAPHATPHPAMRQTPPRQAPPAQPAPPAPPPAQPGAAPPPPVPAQPAAQPPPAARPAAPPPASPRVIVPHPSMPQSPPRTVVNPQPQPQPQPQVRPHAIPPTQRPPEPRPWHGRPVQTFHPERGVPPGWRSGHWHHELHDGRLGWWWVTGTSWYFFPVPVYPYPLYPYSDQPPPMEVPPPDEGQGTEYWYFCEPAHDYYPYVRDCPEDWQPVPITPED